MGENDALGRAGRARCKEHECRVLAGAARGLGLQEVTLFGGEFAALLQQGGVADKLPLPVVAHAAVLVVDDALDRGTARQYFEQLVDLLLVFGKDVGNFRALDRRRNLVRRRILIERHHDGAEPLRRAHRRIQARPVVAQQGDMRAALQASRRRCSRKRGGFFGQFAPGYGAPDAAALFTDGRTFTPFSGVMHQQLRKSIQVQIPSRHLPRSPMPPQSPWRAERAWRNHPQNVGMQCSGAPRSACTNMQTHELRAALADTAHDVRNHIVRRKDRPDAWSSSMTMSPRHR